MVKIEKIVVGRLKTNCYLIETEFLIAIIDPGSEADFISEKVNAKQKPLRAIFLTHGHFDHVLGAMDLKLIFGCPIYVNSLDKSFLKRARETALFYKSSGNFLNPQIDIDIKNMSEIKLDDMAFRIIKTPGHTPGGVCFYSKSEKILFSGDIFFADGSVVFTKAEVIRTILQDQLQKL